MFITNNHASFYLCEKKKKDKVSKSLKILCPWLYEDLPVRSTDLRTNGKLTIKKKISNCIFICCLLKHIWSSLISFTQRALQMPTIIDLFSSSKQKSIKLFHTVRSLIPVSFIKKMFYKKLSLQNVKKISTLAAIFKNANFFQGSLKVTKSSKF